MKALTTEQQNFGRQCRQPISRYNTMKKQNCLPRYESLCRTNQSAICLRVLPAQLRPLLPFSGIGGLKLKTPQICPYCGGKVIFTDSAILYGGKSHGDIYLCTNCNASVGIHHGTKKPLGTLANSALKLKRRETHSVFDAWWKSRKISRNDGYKWLSKQMKLPEYRTHIGNFDMEQCEQLLQLCYKNSGDIAA